jgi:hypothetical protein
MTEIDKLRIERAEAKRRRKQQKLEVHAKSWVEFPAEKSHHQHKGTSSEN